MGQLESRLATSVHDLSQSSLPAVASKAIAGERAIAQLRAHATDIAQASKKLAQYCALRARNHAAKLEAIDALLSIERPAAAIVRFERAADDDARLTTIVSQNVLASIGAVQQIGADLAALRHAVGDDPLFVQTDDALARIRAALDSLRKDSMHREGVVQLQRAITRDLQSGKDMAQDLRALLAGLERERQDLIRMLSAFAGLESTGRALADQSRQRAATWGLISTEAPAGMLGVGGAAYLAGAPLAGLCCGIAALLLGAVLHSMADAAKETANELAQGLAEREKALQAKLETLYPRRPSVADRIKRWFS